MGRYAQVHEATGFVANVIEWDGDPANYQPPAGYVMVEDEPPSAGPGYTWDGTKFTPPPSGTPSQS